MHAKSKSPIGYLMLLARVEPATAPYSFSRAQFGLLANLTAADRADGPRKPGDVAWRGSVAAAGNLLGCSEMVVKHV